MAAALDVQVEPSGHFVVHTRVPDWRFEGDVGQPVSAIRQTSGQDALGSYTETAFDAPGWTSSIRAYADLSIVLFSTTPLADAPPTSLFPALRSYPNLPYQLSFRDAPFSPAQLNRLADAPDGPWAFFDTTGNTFVLSPANDLLVARLGLDADGTLHRALDSQVGRVPAGATEQTLLVVGSAPNQTLEAWGTALTALHGKPRPANDADLVLARLGYWTDNGASYYYRDEPSLGYAGTLLATTADLRQRGVGLGYLQLDSWWYPKGPHARWDDGSGGIWRYVPAPELFPDGLAAFQHAVGLPLVTHARWIDPASPLRQEFTWSGNVITDPRYWDATMQNLHAAGVVTYEQDWLGAQAQPVYDRAAPEQFMGNMAHAAAAAGLSLQYCMPLPRHLLQSVVYPNATTARVSDDRFGRERWDAFLYTSRLASALGLWPWADVFLSTERDNLLLATLSGGVVGIGDALGQADVATLRHVERADGVLIKPDAALVPTDATLLGDAQAAAAAQAGGGPPSSTGPPSSAGPPSGAGPPPGTGLLPAGGPMVAATWTDHAGLRALYVFAYVRGGAGPQTVSVVPSALGLAGPSYVEDVFGGTGTLLGPDQAYTPSVADTAYYVVAPVGPSGIAVLGDAGAFVSLGRARISQLRDDGTVQVGVEFAAGEQAVVLHGYAPSAPAATAVGGGLDPLDYDAASQRFSLTVHPTAAPGHVDVLLWLP